MDPTQDQSLTAQPESEPLPPVQLPEPQKLAPGTIPEKIVNPDDRPEPTASRKAHVRSWVGIVQAALKFHDKPFRQMRDDMLFAKGKQWADGSIDKYVCNIVQRHLNQRVAQLYAKNPKIVARRRPSMDFAIWDESEEMVKGIMIQVQQAQQAAQMGMQQPPSPQIVSLIQDIQNGMNKRKLMDKMAKTIEIVADYTLRMQQPVFKDQMKQLVRRVLTTGVGYIKIGFQRAMMMRPEDAQKITDVTQQIERMMQEGYDADQPDFNPDSPSVDALQVQLAQLQAAPQQMVKREGIVIDFPRSNQIIIDPKCVDIVGFVGGDWIAEEFILSTDAVKRIYHVDLKKGDYTGYSNPDDRERREVSPERDEFGRYKEKSMCARIWEIHNKVDGMVYVVCDGYNDFLKEPGYPEVKLNGFWPVTPLVFNPREDDTGIYPQSDVYLIRDMQAEYNREREGLREHRYANRPKMAVAKGRLSKSDIQVLKNHEANSVLEIEGMQPTEKVEDVLQPIKMTSIDPALYDVTQVFQDIQRVVGSQEADLGGTSGASATETNISESNRMTSIASNIDDLEGVLNIMADNMGQVAFAQMSVETVQKIVGPGAVWKQLNPQDVSDELYLIIEAGSNGRPNKQAEIDNFSKMAPFILQIPGVDPMWVLRQLIQRLDDRLDPTDAMAAGLQSIVNMNAAQSLQLPLGGSQQPEQPGSLPQPSQGSPMPPQQAAGGPPANNPALQGPHGAMNTPAPPQTVHPPGGGSPLVPAPTH